MLVLFLVLGALLWGLGFAAMQDRKALREALNRGRAEGALTAPELARVIEDLRPTLEQPPRIPVPTPGSVAHVWKSPQGQKVYLN